ncbi:hypothetical protein [Streptomyces sp. NPDC059071]|uniref:hypothetical protein n=1 Tax=unclassified Streptomyces TaxID=2593676 RepID=UPI00363B4CFC
MGLDITVLIADWSWLSAAPAPERPGLLRDAWYDDATGFWEADAPVTDGGWILPRGPHQDRFALYEFTRTTSSFKPHFWAGSRWEDVRDHVDRALRADLDTVLRGLIWDGPEGVELRVEREVFGDGPEVYGVLLARTPAGVRELAAAWDRAARRPPGLGVLRAPFDAHAADPTGWVGEFGEFELLLRDWGLILTEAARRGWAVVGLSE